MGLFNGTAIGVMLKSMFPAIIEKVEALETDGTIDKLLHVFQTMAQNGTAEQLIVFASRLEVTNATLERIETLMREANEYAKAGSSSDATRLIEHDGAGMSEPIGTN